MHNNLAAAPMGVSNCLTADNIETLIALAREAAQITSGIPGGAARACSTVLATVLAEA